MLMLLSLLTYARLETFRSSQVFEVLFEHYMQKMERGYPNKISEIVYDEIHIKKKPAAPSQEAPPAKDKETKPEETKPAEKPKDSRPRLSLAALFDKTKKDSSVQSQQMGALLKTLMQTLYGNQPFFKKLEQERPQFMDELIQAMVEAADMLPKEKKLKKASDLANLKLADETLDTLLYKILRGGPYLDVLENSEVKKEPPLIEEEKNDLGDSDGTTSEEFESPKGYFSLLDFVTLEPSSKVRVFLAPREVLTAIFQNPEVVDRIMAERRDLYRQARRGTDVNTLKEAFKNQFDNLRNPAVDSTLLDYSVSKTDPKKYEVKDDP